MPRSACRVAAAAITAAALGAMPALAGEQNALVIHCGGLDALLTDDRDEGLLRALGMVDARLAELPREIDDPEADIGVAVIRLAWNLLTEPMTLQAGVDEDADPNAGPPFYGQVLFERSRRQRRTLGESIGNILDMTGADTGEPLEDNPDVRVVDMPPMRLFYGPARGGYAISLNKRTDAAPPPNPGLPEGVEPVLAFEYDGPAAQPFIGMVLAQMGPDAEMVRGMLDNWGITGPQASSVVAAVGHGADRAHASWRYTNYVPVAERMGFLVREPINRRTMSLVPMDASYCEIGKYPMSSLAEWIEDPEAAMGFESDDFDTEEIDEAMDEFAAETGVHPVRDLIAHLGDTYGFYMSDTTGGGGMMSSVMFLETTNEEAMTQSLDRLARTFNDAVEEETKGYVRVRRTEGDELSFTTLIFPGLPIPLEISWTVSNGYVFAAATPHALLSAVRQATARRRSLLDNPGFMAMGGDNWEDAMYIQYVDVPRYARAGYGMLQLGTSALANFVRSPHTEKRDPGLICPSFNDLLADAKPTVNMYGLDGDDLRGFGQGDKSVLVQLAAAGGFIMDSGVAIAGGALVAGVTLPALAKAKENARAAKAGAQVRQMAMAIMTYASENDDRLPRDWEELTWENFLTEPMLDSPMGPVSDDGGDFWINTQVKRIGDVSNPSRTVLVYDRAMFERGDNVVVGFFDGHVETMNAWALMDLSGDDHNAEFDFDFP